MFTNWIKPKPYLLTRMNRLLQTIKYIVVLLIGGNKALAQFDVMTGLSNDQDGYNFWNNYKTDPIYQKDKNFYNGVTPAGFFQL